jgi:hypothetical protein
MDVSEVKKSLKTFTPCPWGSGHHDLRGQKLTLFEKFWLGSRIVFDVSTAANLSNRFILGERCMRKYAKAFLNGTILHECDGRPNTFDCISAQVLISKTDKKLKLETPEFTKLLNEEAQATAQRHGKQYYDITAPCRQTLWRQEKRLGIASGVGEETTSARVTATSSIFNAVSFAAMNMLMVPLVRVYMICNMDATQFAVGHSSNGRVYVKYHDVDGRPKTLKSQSKRSGIVAYFVKYFLLIFADGSAGRPVYVVADDNMDAEAIDVHKVTGMGIGVDPASYGYIIFCKTRCCNVKFFEWLNGVYLFEELQLKKSIHGLGDNDMTWFQLDGEPVQIKVYSDPAMLDRLTTMGVCIGKPPASTTEITQPCDAKHCFLGPKTALKFVNASDLDGMSWLSDKLEAVFRGHEGKLGKKMPAHHMKLFTTGLLRIQIALQNSMRPKLIRDSFRLTGIYPLDPKQILKNCKSPIGNNELVRIMDVLPTLVRKLKVEGELFYDDFVRAGIRQTDFDERKDDLVIYRRTSCVLTNMRLVTRERLKAEAAADVKEAKAEKAAERKKRKQEGPRVPSQKKARCGRRDGGEERTPPVDESIILVWK